MLNIIFLLFILEVKYYLKMFSIGLVRFTQISKFFSHLSLPKHSDSHLFTAFYHAHEVKKIIKMPGVWYDTTMMGKCVCFSECVMCVYTCLFWGLLWAGGGWFIPKCAASRHIIAKWGEEGLMGKGLGRRGRESEGQRKNVGEVTVHHDNWTNCLWTDLYLKILLGWGTWVQQNGNTKKTQTTRTTTKNRKGNTKQNMFKQKCLPLFLSLTLPWALN